MDKISTQIFNEILNKWDNGMTIKELRITYSSVHSYQLWTIISYMQNISLKAATDKLNLSRSKTQNKLYTHRQEIKNLLGE